MPERIHPNACFDLLMVFGIPVLCDSALKKVLIAIMKPIKYICVN
jgi:hypothetical protein